MCPINIMDGNFLSQIIFYNVNNLPIRYFFHPLHVQEDNSFLNTFPDDLAFCQPAKKKILRTPNLLLILLFIFAFLSGQLCIPQIFRWWTFQLLSAFNLGILGRGRKFVNFSNSWLYIFKTVIENTCTKRRLCSFGKYISVITCFFA